MSLRALLLIAFTGLCVASAQAADLIVITPSRSELTQTFVGELRLLRPADRIVVHEFGDTSPMPDGTRLITMGQAALHWRLGKLTEVPTVATYVSLHQLDSLEEGSIPQSMQLLLANPAPVRQTALAVELLPRARTLGLLYSPQSKSQLQAWRSAVQRFDMLLYTKRVPQQRDLGRRVVEAIDSSDVLIALDDPTIYNAENLRTLLLTSYSRNKVLIGPGAPFIAAGSLSTTFSSPADTARSVHEMFDQQWQPARITYPQHFSVLSNQKVARSLGFPPIDDEALAAKIATLEGNP